jgi:hypothetical protein
MQCHIPLLEISESARALFVKICQQIQAHRANLLCKKFVKKNFDGTLENFE